MAGDPTRPDGLLVTNRYGVSIGPPRWRDLKPRGGGDPPGRMERAAYTPPSGERARWHDIEIPPDAELPATG
jgi:hypothetical protein